MSEESLGLIEENREMLLDILENVDNKPKENIKAEIVDCLSHFKANQEPTLSAQVVCDDAKACYDFVNLDKPRDKKYSFLASSELDYNIPRDAEAIKKGHKEDLPISFLSIQEGEVERGTQWYQERFDKLPPEMASLLARYNWGDLKYQNKKKIKNDRKKAIRKGKNYEPLAFKVEHKKVVVQFD